MTTPTRTLTAPGDVRGAGPPPRAALGPGDRVGRYQLGAALGAGGMATVYRAEDRVLRRAVALKLLRPDLAMSPRARARFVREGQAMAALTHPNVAVVFDVGEDDERPYLALELCEGGTLAAWLATPRSWRAVMAMMTSAARGLAAAHRRGIVHRDFKPDNVLLTVDGTPRVSDFGLAGPLDEPGGAPGDATTRARSTHTDADTLLGTPAFMAPEQRAGAAADARADQYSLCVAWRGALGDDAPAWLRALLARGVADDPAARWPSVDALLAAIARGRRRRRLALGGAAILAVGVAIAVVARARAASPSPSPPRQLVELPHDRGGRLRLTRDGASIVRASSDRARLELFDPATGHATPLALPPGALLSPRIDALAGASRDGTTVVVRTDDRAVWRTGRGLAAPMLLAAGANGAACVDDRGARVAVGRSREPLFVRSADDGRVLAEAPTADFCAWRGDELVLAVRDRERARIRVRAADGTVRELAELPGDLAGVAIDRDGRIVVAQNPPGADGAIAGALVTIDDDGRAAVTQRARPGVRYQHLADTDRGLVIARIEPHARVVIAAVAPPPGPPPATRSLALPFEPTGAPRWIDDDQLLIGSAAATRAVRVDGATPPGSPLALPGALVDLDGDTRWSNSRVEPRPGVPDARCALLATRGAETRTVAQWRCADRRGLVCAHGACVVGLIVDDDVWLSRLDRTDGTLSPAVITRPHAGEPAVAIGRDGRWLVASGGAIAIVDPHTGATTPIATPGLHVIGAAWSPDGRSVIASTRSALARVDLADAGAVTIIATEASNNLGPITVSPDGTWVAALVHDRVPDFVELR